MPDPRLRSHGSFLCEAIRRMLPALVLLALTWIPSRAAEDDGVEQALLLYRRGEAEAALTMLRGLVETASAPRQGDQAALVLGNLLIECNRHSEAIPPLERAEKGVVAPEYARLLLVRAITEGGEVDKLARADELASSLQEDLLLGSTRPQHFVELSG